MRVRRSKSRSEPKYPTQHQFADYKKVLGAAAIGLSSVAAWAQPQRTAGVPIRTGGEMVAEPRQGTNTATGATAKQPATDTPRLGGDIAVVPLPGEPPPVMPGQGATNTQTSATYAVKKGDTLSTIAAQFLGDRNRWREIAAANPGIAPDALKPGQVVVLPAGCRAAAK